MEMNEIKRYLQIRLQHIKGIQEKIPNEPMFAHVINKIKQVHGSQVKTSNNQIRDIFYSAKVSAFQEILDFLE